MKGTELRPMAVVVHLAVPCDNLVNFDKENRANAQTLLIVKPENKKN